MFAAHRYHRQGQVLVAACDQDLLDTEHQEEAVRLEVPSGFYDGMRVDEAELAALLRGCTIANLVGPNTVKVAVELGIVDAEHVRTVDGVPHAQLVTV